MNFLKFSTYMPYSYYICLQFWSNMVVLKWKFFDTSKLLKYLRFHIKNISFPRYETPDNFTFRKIMAYFMLMLFKSQFAVTRIQFLTTSLFFLFRISLPTLHCYIESCIPLLLNVCFCSFGSHYISVVSLFRSIYTRNIYNFPWI